MELFFESRTNFSEFIGDLVSIQNQPIVHPEPVLKGDSVADENGVSIYGSVLRDGGIYRMWYQASPRQFDYSRNDPASVGYAESDNGIDWRKPALNLVDCGGEPNHLCNFGLHCPSVFIDPESPSTHRYRGTGYGAANLFMGDRRLKKSGFYTIHSADGIRWEMDQEHPQWDSGDVITSIYHPGQKRAISAMKYYSKVGQIYRRCIHTAEMRNGVYSRPVSAFYPDEYDDFAAVSRGSTSCDYYGMGMMPAGSGTVAFLWNYWHNLPYTRITPAGGAATDGFALYGSGDVTLAYQPEPGGRWMHMRGRRNFFDRKSYPWMSDWVYTSSCPVEVGDEHWLYFTGSPFEHGFTLDEGWNRHEKRAELVKKSGGKKIGILRWPKHRLFGIEASRTGSFTVNLGSVTSPAELKLNYKTRPSGSVRVEVLNHPGYSLDCNNALTGDSINEIVTWKSGARMPVSAENESLKVRIHLERATVYAYSIESTNA